MIIRLALLCFALFILPLLQACSPLTPLVEGGQQAYDGARRPALRSDADASDPAAQFKLGNSYCCQAAGPLNHVSVYDNEKATHWYCEAAHQGYGPAQLALARVYSGQQIRGVHLTMRASNLMGTTSIDRATALMWSQVAMDNQVYKADDLHAKILKDASDADRAKADTLLADWKNAPCEWSQVFPGAVSAEAK